MTVGWSISMRRRWPAMIRQLLHNNSRLQLPFVFSGAALDPQVYGISIYGGDRGGGKVPRLASSPRPGRRSRSRRDKAAFRRSRAPGRSDLRRISVWAEQKNENCLLKNPRDLTRASRRQEPAPPHRAKLGWGGREWKCMTSISGIFAGLHGPSGSTPPAAGGANGEGIA